MVKKRQAGEHRTSRRILPAFALGLALATGCSTTGSQATAPQPPDPLHGHRTPPGLPVPESSKPPTVPTSGTKTSSFNPTPIGSADLSSSNNATLAGMSGQSPLGRPLAIDDGARPLAPGQLMTGSKSQSAPVGPAGPFSPPGPNPNPKVEAIPDASPNSQNPSPNSWQPGATQPVTPVSQVQPAAPAVPTAPTTAETLTRRLQERGVVNQKVDQLSQGIHLTCYVSRGTEGGLRILEATAADYATAAQAILNQLDGNR